MKNNTKKPRKNSQYNLEEHGENWHGSWKIMRFSKQTQPTR